MRFRILQGKHEQGKKVRDEKGRVTSDTRQYYGALHKGRPKLHPVTGEPLPSVIETDIDLVERFGHEKFERLPDVETSSKKG